jgi:hypothetical protein
LKRLLLVVALLLAGRAGAEQAGVPIVPMPEKDTVEPIHQISPITNRIPAIRYPFAQGRLEKIDVGKQKLTMAAPGGPYHFSYQDRTYIFLNKEKVTADALKPGDVLHLNFVTNSVGEATIRRIKAEREEPSDTVPPPATSQ